MASREGELLHITVDVWHPSCWTLETTRETDAGLYGHGTTVRGGDAAGVFTVYGDSRDEIEAHVAAVRESPLTDSVADVPHAGAGTLGSATRTILVEFDPVPSIREAFTSRGFVHYGPTRHEDGRERRSFLVRADRREVRGTLEAIEAEYDADLDLTRVTTVANGSATGSSPPPGPGVSPADRLSRRQREAFRLARTRGYYDYPRRVDARELAAELDISKTTFLEHLRKAESKLLSAIDPR